MNFAVTILIEGEEGAFVEARAMFVGLTAKGKFLIVEKNGEKNL